MQSPPAQTLILPDPNACARLGGAIAARLRRGEAVCLCGPLGAGKSTLARGLVRALTTPDEEVPSPTFTLVQTYAGPRLAVAHFDLYRLKSPDEAYELGLEEALADGAAVIEWPERLGDDLPPDRLDIHLSVAAAATGADVVALGEDAPGLRDSTAMAHGSGVSVIFSDPRSLEAPADLSARPALRAAFVQNAGLADAQVAPLAGDASTRAYSRLTRPGRAP